MTNDLHFFFSSYSKALAEQLNVERNHSFVVAITGTWGSGKTTLMDQTLDLLNEKIFIKVHFNAWRYTKEDAVWRAFFAAILEQLQAHVDEHSVVVRNNWDSQDLELCKALIDETEKSLYTSFSTDIPGEITLDAGNLAKSGAKLALKFVPWGAFGSELIDNIFIPKDDKGNPKDQSLDATDIDGLWGIFKRSVIKRQIEKLTSMEQFRQSMDNLLNAILKGQYTSTDGKTLKEIPKDRQYRLIVAIDDLDRCLPEQALEIFEAIKLFIDLPAANFILAIDQDMIQHALDLRYKQSLINRPQILAKEYTEKMIDLTFAIPPANKVSFQKYIETSLPNGPLLLKMYDTLSIALPNNIRTWQRFSAKADLNQKIIKTISEASLLDEQNLQLFYKLQCLSYRWPEIFQNIGSMAIYRELERCVDEAKVHKIGSEINADELAKEIRKSSQNSDQVPERLWNIFTERSLAAFLTSAPRTETNSDLGQFNIWFSLDAN
jgi:Cdc6-like AAA superfamily ATPase